MGLRLRSGIRRVLKEGQQELLMRNAHNCNASLDTSTCRPDVGKSGGAKEKGGSVGGEEGGVDEVKGEKVGEVIGGGKSGSEKKGELNNFNFF